MNEGRPSAGGRPLRWVGLTLYLTVLLTGGYFHWAGLCPRPGGSATLTGFAAGLGVLLALEWLDRPAWWVWLGRARAAGPLVVRAVLIHAVVALDCSGLARVLLLLIPFAAYLSLGRRAGHLTAAGYGVGLVIALTLADPGWPTDPEAVSDLLMFGVGLIFAVAIATVATAADASRGRAEMLLDELGESHRQLRASADRVAELATAEERNRLARDIHDSLGHHLTAISIQLEKAAAYRDRDAGVADRALADARSAAGAALTDVRRSVAALRTERSTTAGQSMQAALAALALQLGAGTVAVGCTVQGDERRYPEAARTALYRAAQEGLTNALRHADAARVSVTVDFAADAAVLTVADDGLGLPAQLAEGFGLAGMRERLAAVGGALRLESASGTGTTLTATVPGTPVGAAR